MDRVIVSRHPAAVEFIRRELPKFTDAPVLATATSENVVGRDVAGNLPLDLAARARTVFAICFRGDPPRGQEIGIADMDAAGAHIEAFVVIPAAVAGMAAAEGFDVKTLGTGATVPESWR